MPYIQVNDKQYPLHVGEVRVGGGPDAHVRVPGDAGAVHAIVELSADNHAAIRRASDGAVVRVNGVQLGVEPTPLIHGDKIEVAGQELTFGDDRKGGNTQFVSAADLAALAQRARSTPARPTGSTGGRLVSLVDGREYAVPNDGLSIGRDASCDVVVPSTEVSRHHAEIRPSPAGYVLADSSTNGVFVNGQRIAQSALLSRGDVLRIGNEEFRFYADSAPAPDPLAAAPTAQTPATPTPAAAPAQPPAPASMQPPAPQPAPAAAAFASAPAQTPAAPVAAPAPQPLTPAAPAPAGRPVLATLEIVNEGVLKGTRFEITSPLAHVGRGAHNDVIITEDSVSDSHAKLQKRESGWFVVDMGSTNGTYVGGRRIEGEAALTGSPDVRFGGVKLTFRSVGETADDGKGTRAIAGISAEQARRMRESRSPSPAAEAPAPAETPVPSRGIPAWVWVVALLLAAAAAFFILQGR